VSSPGWTKALTCFVTRPRCAVVLITFFYFLNAWAAVIRDFSCVTGPRELLPVVALRWWCDDQVIWKVFGVSLISVEMRCYNEASGFIPWPFNILSPGTGH
jgi:hypothetical protein